MIEDGEPAGDVAHLVGDRHEARAPVLRVGVQHNQLAAYRVGPEAQDLTAPQAGVGGEQDGVAGIRILNALFSSRGAVLLDS